MSKRILIIDDDLDTLRLVGLMLQRQGYQISAATNGQQGLEKAFNENPDLILLDIMMPDMDGYEVTRRLRRNPSTIETPVLMFTAKTQLADKVSGFEAGANDYTDEAYPSIRTAGTGQDPSFPDRRQKRFRRRRHGARPWLCHRRALCTRWTGTTTLAVNLGASLTARTQSNVIVAEMVPGAGHAGA